MIIAGTALFINALAWTDGIWDSILESSSDATGHFRVVTPAHAERESLRPIDENIEDVGALLESLKAVPGVEATAEREGTPADDVSGHESAVKNP